ncbi:type II toxin-antitoxin system VapC family toxin [Sphingomonas oligophenolica]|uniref:Ribonuclease VapC n=1 Tax=Sphingomonas oligophenolica TaxID=301154 RepID=A0ABU9Y2B9_9SPHN
MLYLDTSVIIAALLPEDSTARIHAWLAAQDAGSLYVSGWALTEVSSALAIKVRTGALTPEQRAEVIAAWTNLRAASLTMLPVTEAHFATAAGFIDHVDLGLRAGDALHLAVAAGAGQVMVTLDRLLATAATALGVRMLMP